MDILNLIGDHVRRARAASRALAKAGVASKNGVLRALAQAIREAGPALHEANERDLAAARADGIAPALLAKRILAAPAITALAARLEQIAQLPDPIGVLSDMAYRPSGIQVGRMRVPLGVIGMPYQPRAHLPVDALGLCIKSGNALLTCAGTEAARVNLLLADLAERALIGAGLPTDALCLIEHDDPVALDTLIASPAHADLLIPRGDKAFIERLMRDARIPLLKHIGGVCHVYIDDKADLEKALRLAFNAKCHRYDICNAMETLLVARGVAAAVLPGLAALYIDKAVELRCDPEAHALLVGYPHLSAATEADWRTEYLGAVLAVKIVEDLDEAIEHIHQYSTRHTEAIVTEDYTRGMRFLREIDSASVMINASTRFTDGFEFGLNAEVGISNDKLHARGPVGLEGLTSLKYVVLGTGQVRV